ncbi:MAG: DUF4143 domain-containing protein [bacterium]|nr:DUF4143 domain-containing protein [bacterium]
MGKSNTLTMPGYRERVIGADVEAALKRRGAVLIQGARGVGKTWTSRDHAFSEVRLDDTDMLALAETDPDYLLSRPPPLLIDEWQYAPGLWNRIRRACDDRPGTGHFILTGSARPTDSITRHTGTGRITRLLMRPMTLWEAGISTGEVSLRRVLDGSMRPAAESRTTLLEVAKAVCRGGWPGSLDLAQTAAAASVRDYIQEAIRTDIEDAVGVRHNPDALEGLLRLISHDLASPVTAAKLGRDMNPASPPAAQTLASYLDALRRVFVLEDLPAWSPELRSKATVRKAPKRHLVDPSLAAALIGASPSSLMANFSMFGRLFESLTVRDLRVYAQPMGFHAYHYHDSDELETDVVIQGLDGTWASFEVKLNSGPRQIEEAATALKRLRDKAQRRRADQLALMAVITATKTAYMRPDGVAVIPITALGP